MPRYINADKLKSWWTERYNPRDTVGVNQVIDAIENAPTALVSNPTHKYCQYCGKKIEPASAATDTSSGT